jgi:hypothetical protein
MLLIAVLSISIVGCSSKDPIVKTEYIYVDRVVTKYLPTACEIPKVKCSIDTNSTYTAKVRGVVECVENLIKVQEINK